MGASTNITKSLVSISQFNKGQASRIFDRLHTEDQIVVLKNNKPEAVIVSLEEYDRLTEAEEDNYLLIEAIERLQKNDDKPGVSMDEIMADLGITQKDLDAIDDVEFE